MTPDTWREKLTREELTAISNADGVTFSVVERYAIRIDELTADNAALRKADIEWRSIAADLQERRDELKAERIALRERLARIAEKIESIVCTAEPDRGVVLLSSDGPTHYDPEVKCQVYDHENFSPLGDALIELHELAKGE